MAIAEVNSSFAEDTSGTHSSITVTFASAPIAGDLIVVMISHNNGGGVSTTTVSSVTDTSGNTYVHAAGSNSQVINGSWVANSDVWYCQNCLGGATTATVNFSAATDTLFVTLAEYSGVKQSGALDQVGTNTGGGSVVGPSITPSVAGELLVAVAAEGQYLLTNVNSPWLKRSVSPDSGYESVDLINGTLTPQAAVFTPTGNTSPFNFASSAAAFLPTPTGPSGKKKGSMFLVM